MTADALGTRLATHRDELVAFLVPRAGWLLRYESADDLAQGTILRALERGADAEFPDDRRFFAWMYQVAKSHLADRANHWSALKRGAARLVRLTAGGGENRAGTPAAPTPASTLTGPSTVADRREALTLVIQVLGTLPERDAMLVRWAGEGLPLAEQAAQLGVSYDAAKKAGQRAIARFRDAHRFANGF